MREIDTHEISMVAGAASPIANQAHSCTSDIYGGSGVGAAFGTAIGTIVGSAGGPPGAVFGGAMGAILGGSLGGAAEASSSPNCRGPVPIKQN